LGFSIARDKAKLRMASERCVGLDQFKTHLIGQTVPLPSHLAPGLPGRVGDKLQG
jgi:hypothetical protein